MHDAPPPPLDRQGIGRLRAGPAVGDPRAPTSHSTTPPGGVTRVGGTVPRRGLEPEPRADGRTARRRWRPRGCGRAHRARRHARSLFRPGQAASVEPSSRWGRRHGDANEDHVDLYEYQGRALFARHGLPVLGGGVAETPEEARAIAEQLGGRVVVKAQVKVGGRGKAGGVKLAESADEAHGHGDRHPRHGHQGPHGPQGHGHHDGRHRRGVLLLVPARPGQPHVPVHRQRGRRHGDRAGRARGAGEGRQGRHRRGQGRRRGHGPRDRRRRPASRPRSPTRSSTSRSSCGRPSSPRTPPWSRSTRWPRRPTARCSASTPR